MAFLKIIGIGLLIYAGLVGFVWLLQERIAFPAPRRPLPEPAAMGLQNAETVEVTTSDNVLLRGWYLKPVSDSARSESQLVPSASDDSDQFQHARHPALIWFYGNFETVGVMAPVINLLRPPGFGVLVLDIRGYGESGGSSSEEGFYRDAEAAWDFLSARPEIDTARIAVYGRSLGTALATYLAVSKPVAAVILEAPFTSGRDLAASFYWWFPRAAVRIRMDNLSRISQVDAPVLVMHGSEDEIVPLEMGQEIATAAGTGLIEVFDGAGHNDMLMGHPERFRRVWEEFLAGTVGRGYESADQAGDL